MKREETKHPTGRGAEAGLIAGIIAFVAAGLAGVGADGAGFWTFPETIGNLFALSDGALAIIVGLLLHLGLSALFGAIYAYLAHWADFDRFESIVPLFLGAMIYSIFLYVMTFTLLVGVLFPDAAESSLAVSMTMVFVYSVTLALLLWRPRVVYEELDQGVPDVGASTQVREQKLPHDPPKVK